MIVCCQGANPSTYLKPGTGALQQHHYDSSSSPTQKATERKGAAEKLVKAGQKGSNGSERKLSQVTPVDSNVSLEAT